MTTAATEVIEITSSGLGAINKMTIGATTPAAGTFTTLTTTGSIELGHASDTTLARVSAGVVSIEGSNILVSGGALGTPSSGTLTNSTGLPITGITSSTSAQLRTLLSDENGTGAALFDRALFAQA